jgi:hypothetical protein
MHIAAAEATQRHSVIDILRSKRQEKDNRGGGKMKEMARWEAQESEFPLSKTCDVSPIRRRAVESLRSYGNLGDYIDEVEAVRALSKAPVDRRVPVSHHEQIMQTKASMEVATQFLLSLRDAATEHFLRYPAIPSTGATCPPMAFSVPVHLVECPLVSQALVRLCSETFGPPVPMEEAVRLDVNVGRKGGQDDCSFHHEMYARLNGGAGPERESADAAHSSEEPSLGEPASTANESVPENSDAKRSLECVLPCYVIRCIADLTSLMSKIAPFILLTLRTIHAEVEEHAIKSKER